MADCEAATGRIVEMGWTDTEPRRFRAVIEFCAPPEWPLSVVWKAWPVSITPQRPSPAPGKE
jgi:hypothetical protein